MNNKKNAKLNKPKDLPDSKIINALVKKTNEGKQNNDIDYVYKLDELRKVVSAEVSRINELFPEYTPHDEKYHLKRLFNIADELLGDKLIDCMNATELFLLGLALYAHDWGMAVCKDEMDYIISGCKMPAKSQSFCSLNDEIERFKKFCEDKCIKSENFKLGDWQVYIRETHALRSGKRVEKFFEKENSSIADYISRICVGHWLDFDIINDHNSYPLDAAVNGDIVNVKALTIYVRLIDLLDLGEDRTPFVLWKFVAPKNEFSKMEWNKHRALHSVNFPKYQEDMRYILVEGGTDNLDVYMSILDLKEYVNDQFRQCSDILNRTCNSYHKLNLSHINWRIDAKGFEPVSVRFEFDRNRMFDILSDEIYQGNPFVFIRELLQNAIDAIDVRREILAKKEIFFTPKIYIEVTEDDSFYVVQVVDNGIGMDEYIIKNYLTVAGKSYYQSSDFQKEGLNMDPISRFGIGFLSCFMVADYVEVQTFKDPNTTDRQEYLKICIPSKENYFRIEKNKSRFDVGSNFKVYINKNRLPKNKDGKTISFNVTEYVKAIAGFVKFQVIIVENGRKTVIINPNYDAKTFDTENISKISYSYPFDKAVLPQSIDTLKRYFKEEIILIKEDLNLIDYDGCITYLVPRDESVDVKNVGDHWPATEMELIDYKNEIVTTKKIKIDSNWCSLRHFFNEDDNISIREKSYEVFMNGILLQKITPPRDLAEDYKENDSLNQIYFMNLYDTFITQRLIVDIPKLIGSKIDLARTSINSEENWDRSIWKALVHYMKKSKLFDILKMVPSKKMFSLAKLMTYYHLSSRIIIENLIDINDFALPFLSSEGKLVFQNFDPKEHSQIRRLSLGYKNYRKTEFTNLLACEYFEFKDYTHFLKLWRGSYILVDGGTNSFRDFPASINNLVRLVGSFIKRFYYISSVEFVSSYSLKNSLVVEILQLRPDLKIINIDENAIYSTMELENIDAYKLFELYLFIKTEFAEIPKFVKFPSPYESKIFYGFKYLNFNSNFVKNIIKVFLIIIENKKKGIISDCILGRLIDKVKDLCFMRYYYRSEKLKISDLNDEINDLFSDAKKNGLINFELSDVNISLDDFVDYSILVYDDNFFDPINICDDFSNIEWGTPIQ